MDVERHGNTLSPLFHRRASHTPSTLELFKVKPQVPFDRIENAGYTRSNEGGNVVSQLMDEIQVAIIDCQVSSGFRTGSAI